MFKSPTNEEKQAVWDAYNAGNPIRVPLSWGHNSRVVMLDPELNLDGYTYEQMLNDPEVVLTMLPRWQEYGATVLADTCDALKQLPDEWTLWVENHNIYDGAYFGAYFGGQVEFPAGQVPSIEPFLSEADIDRFMAFDFNSAPLENPWIRDRLAFHAQIAKAAEDFEYLDRKGNVVPMTLGFDGPLTVATIILGCDIFPLMAAEPAKARELMLFLTHAAIARNKALNALAGVPEKSEWGGLADDSIQLISGAMYEEVVLPAHELWYNETSNSTRENGKRGIHLCGDATRHFPILKDKLGIQAFDTGFPVDHGWLRNVLGPEVTISGGPHVDLLRHGSADDCYRATCGILQSGVMEGGRFSLREGNNLPPRVPVENLQAVYQACLECGWYN